MYGAIRVLRNAVDGGRVGVTFLGGGGGTLRRCMVQRYSRYEGVGGCKCPGKALRNTWMTLIFVTETFTSNSFTVDKYNRAPVNYALEPRLYGHLISMTTSPLQAYSQIISHIKKRIGC